MIIKREKIYTKRDGFYTNTIRSTSWWLFGIIPIFIYKEIIGRV